MSYNNLQAGVETRGSFQGQGPLSPPSICKNDKPTSVIEAEFETLERYIDELQGVQKHLADRIRPILLPVENVCEVDKPGVSTSVPLADRLRAANVRLGDLCRTVRKTLEQIQL